MPVLGNIFSSIAKKGTVTARNLEKILDKQMDQFNQEYITGSGITLTNNETKDIKKVIKSLEKRGILLNKTKRKIANQKGEVLNFLKPWKTAGLPFIKSVFMSLVKSFFLLLGLSAGMSALYAAIQKKIYGSGTTVLIVSNEKMEDIMKVVKSLEKSGLAINNEKWQIIKIKNEAKEKIGEFLSMLLGTLASILLGSALTWKGLIKAGEGTISAAPSFT